MRSGAPRASLPAPEPPCRADRAGRRARARASQCSAAWCRPARQACSAKYGGPREADARAAQAPAGLARSSPPRQLPDRPRACVAGVPQHRMGRSGSWQAPYLTSTTRCSATSTPCAATSHLPARALGASTPSPSGQPLSDLGKLWIAGVQDPRRRSRTTAVCLESRGTGARFDPACPRRP
jgi:hypothetical protein